MRQGASKVTIFLCIQTWKGEGKTGVFSPFAAPTSAPPLRIFLKSNIIEWILLCWTPGWFLPTAHLQESTPRHPKQERSLCQAASPPVSWGKVLGHYSNLCFELTFIRSSCPVATISQKTKTKNPQAPAVYRIPSHMYFLIYSPQSDAPERLWSVRKLRLGEVKLIA